MDSIIFLLGFIATVAVSLYMDLSELGMIVAYFIILTICVIILSIKDDRNIIRELKEWIGDWLYHLKIAAIFCLILIGVAVALGAS